MQPKNKSIKTWGPNARKQEVVLYLLNIDATPNMCAYAGICMHGLALLVFQLCLPSV